MGSQPESVIRVTAGSSIPGRGTLSAAEPARNGRSLRESVLQSGVIQVYTHSGRSGGTLSAGPEARIGNSGYNGSGDPYDAASFTCGVPEKRVWRPTDR